MVKAILLPSRRTEALKPLTYHTPVGMLPVVNKPLMEHQVEFLVRNRVQHVRISCNHLATKVEGHFQSGAPWGASISYTYEHAYYGAVPALMKMKGFFHGTTLVIMEADVLADINLAAALEFHYRNRSEATFICRATSAPAPGLSIELDSLKRIRAVRMNNSPASSLHLVDSGICIIEPEMLDLLFETAGYNLLQSCWLSSLKVRLNVYGYQTQEPLARVTNWSSYYRIQNDIMEGRFPGVVIPGREVQKGVWLGKNVNASDGVMFEGPAVIGDNCTLGKNVRIGKGTVIGSGVMVESHSLMKRSIVLPKTLIGHHASIQDAIIVGNMQMSINQHSCTTLTDSMTISAMRQRDRGMRTYHVANQILGMILALLLHPFFVATTLWSALRGRFPLLSRVRRIGIDLREFSGGTLKLRIFDLYYLGPLVKPGQYASYPYDPPTRLPRCIARLGNIINIIKGDILFVGNSPMDPEYAFTLSDEWERTRFKCQAGMFSILDARNGEKMSDEERGVTEARYALHRTVRTDLRIALQVGMQTTLRMVGVR